MMTRSSWELILTRSIFYSLLLLIVKNLTVISKEVIYMSSGSTLHPMFIRVELCLTKIHVFIRQ
jgi:hypothetical protein